MSLTLARPVAAIAVLLTGSACISTAAAEQPGAVEYELGQPIASVASTAYPGNDFAAQLSAARGDSAAGACDWGWGVGGSPFRTGPGRCDDFLVGPRWQASLEGVYMFRENIDLPTLAAGATAGGVVIDPVDAGTISENMREGIGARLMLSSYWPQCKGYEMQLGYLGIYNWQANAFDPEVPFDGPLPAPPGTTQIKELTYRSELHSIEFNGQTISDGPIKLFAGGRFVLLTERVSDLLDATGQPPQIPPNTGGGIIGDPALDVTDIMRGVSVDNHLLGMQSGVRLDFLSLTERFHLEGFLSGGAYFNFIKRETQYTETRSRLALDDPSTLVDESVFASNSSSTGYEEDRMRVAFVGEALLGGVYQINRCATARIGYQALYLTGVELGNEAFVGGGPTYGDLLTHGWFGGVEYKR